MTDRTLPAGWAWTTLGKVVCKADKADPAELGRPTFRYIDISSVDGQSQRLAEVPVVETDAAPSRARQLVHSGDTVFSTVRPYLRKIAWLPESFDGEIASTGFCVLRPTSAIDSRFLYFTVTRQAFLDEVIAKQRGVSYPAVRPAEVLEVPIPLPPLPEQHRIVEVLEDHLSRLDAGIANLASAKLRAKMLHRKRPDPAATEFGFPRRVLKSLLREPLRNGHSGRVTQSGSGIRAVTLSAVTRNEFSERYTKLTDTSKSKAESLWLEDGDIFVQRSNAPELVGTSALYRGPNDWAIFPDLLIRVRSDEDEVLPEYLAEVLRSDSVKAYFRRSARGLSGSMPKISQGTIEEVVVPLPTIARQQQWVSDAQESLTTDARLRDSIDTVGERSVALRRSLLRAAFNGELVDQDPTDEPADVALARIRDQRSSTPTRRGRRTAAAQ